MSSAPQLLEFESAFNRREISRLKIDVEAMYDGLSEGGSPASTARLDAGAKRAVAAVTSRVFAIHMCALSWLLCHDLDSDQYVADEAKDNSSVMFRQLSSQYRAALLDKDILALLPDGLRETARMTVSVVDSLLRLDVSIHGDSAGANIASVCAEFSDFFEQDALFAQMREEGWTVEVDPQSRAPSPHVNALLSDGFHSYTLGRTSATAYFVWRHAKVANDVQRPRTEMDPYLDTIVSNSLSSQGDALNLIAEDCGFELAPRMSM